MQCGSMLHCTNKGSDAELQEKIVRCNKSEISASKHAPDFAPSFLHEGGVRLGAGRLPGGVAKAGPIGVIGRHDHPAGDEIVGRAHPRSEEHTSELQSLMRISYAVFCLKKKINKRQRE